MLAVALLFSAAGCASPGEDLCARLVECDDLSAREEASCVEDMEEEAAERSTCGDIQDNCAAEPSCEEVIACVDTYNVTAGLTSCVP